VTADDLRRALVALNRADPDGRFMQRVIVDRPDRWAAVLSVASTSGGPAKAALERLADDPDTPLPLAQVSAAVPADPAGLHELGRLVDERLLGELREAPPADRAELLVRLSERLHAAGDRSGAVAAISAAADLYRDLAAGDETRFGERLLGTLHNLSVLSAEAGDLVAVGAVLEEVIDVVSDLAVRDLVSFRPLLAMALNNAAISRAQTGDRPGGLAAAVESEQLYRGLAGADPGYRDDHARALNTLANRCADAGDRPGALRAAEQAVAVRRELVEVDPMRHGAGLAGVLRTLSTARRAVGDVDGALAAITESTSRYRELIVINPVFFGARLASTLSVHAEMLATLDEGSAALAPAAEAVQLLRAVASAQPEAFQPPLAAALVSLSTVRAGIGDRAAAMAAAREAVAIYRGWVATHAGVRPQLAGALNNLANLLSDDGSPDALATGVEATGIFRHLADADPPAFAPQLAQSSSNLGVLRYRAGDVQGAVAADGAAVDAYRLLAATGPVRFGPALASSLINASAHLARRGDLEPAQGLAGEAVELLERFVAGSPRLRPSLATALVTLGNRQGDSGRPMLAAG